MPISDRPFAVRLCAAILVGGASLVGAPSSQAFELKSSDPDAVTASRALPALPQAVPALPDLGVDKGIRDLWRGFSRSYKSGDKQAALKQLEVASSQGDILARWKLGRMYADGDGVTQDDYKAFRLFSSIADTRADESPESPHAGVVANSIVALGLYWLDGIPQSPVKANVPESFKAFHHAATLYAHPEAQFQLARMLMDGVLGKPERRQGLRWLNLAAEKGHLQAQAILGRILFTGDGTQRQAWRGLMWLHVARENATTAKDGWVMDIYNKAYEGASEEDRKTAKLHAERFIKAQGNIESARR